MTPFPWDNAMQFGFGILRLSPKQFWAMTPRELAAAWRGVAGVNAATAALPRDRLDELITNFPDKEPDNGRK